MKALGMEALGKGSEVGGRADREGAQARGRDPGAAPPLEVPGSEAVPHPTGKPIRPQS